MRRLLTRIGVGCVDSLWVSIQT